MNAKNISIFKQSNVLRIVPQKYTKMNEISIIYANHNKMSSNKRKVPDNLEKDVCVYF